MVNGTLCPRCCSLSEAQQSKLISQTFKEDRLIHKDSCLIRQLAYVDVKVIYISVRIQNNDGHFA